MTRAFYLTDRCGKESRTKQLGLIRESLNFRVPDLTDRSGKESHSKQSGLTGASDLTDRCGTGRPRARRPGTLPE